MKRILLVVAVLGALCISCNNSTKSTSDEASTTEVKQEHTYDLKGYRFEDTDAISSEELLAKYEGLKEGDTLEVKVRANVKSVCQKKGCWMRLDMGEKESFVRFLDYGFFMPKDLAGSDVLVNGKIYLEETSLDDLKHYALDAGKTQEEIDAITAPEISYNFLSTGVLIPTNQVE